MKLNYVLLGRRIRSLRRKHHFSQQDLAFLSGVSDSYISKIENSRIIPSLDAIIQIARLFNVSVSSLLDVSLTFSLCVDEQTWTIWVQWLKRDSTIFTLSALRLNIPTVYSSPNIIQLSSIKSLK